MEAAKIHHHHHHAPHGDGHDDDGESSTANDVIINSEGRKQFIALENSPEALTALASDLGLSLEDIAFHDVYSIDDPAALAAVPRPVFALIFIAPPDAVLALRAQDGTRVVARDGLTYKSGGDHSESVLWFYQTVNNACGLFALLHGVANSRARDRVRPGSLLARTIAAAAPLGAQARAALIYDSDEIAAVHARAARRGASRVMPASVHAEHHFVAFVRAEDGEDDGRLWELEGDTDGPIERGRLAAGEDLLSDRALDLTVRKFMRAAGGNVNFSIVALAARSPAAATAAAADHQV